MTARVIRLTVIRTRSAARSGDKRECARCFAVMTSPITSGLEPLRRTTLRNDSHAARISTAVSDAGGCWCAVAHTKFGWRTMHQNPPKRNPRISHPPPTTRNGIALLTQSSSPPLLPPPSLAITPPPPFLLLLLLLALTSQLGSAADRSPGFSLLGQNGGGGLSLNEGSTDCMTGSASMKGAGIRFCR